MSCAAAKICVCSLLLLLSACAPVEIQTDLQATPTPIILRLHPGLEPAANAIQVCQEQSPNLAVFVDYDLTDDGEVALSIDYSGEDSNNAYLLGYDRLYLVLSTDVNLVDLSVDTVLGVFRSSAAGVIQPEIQAGFAYPENHPYRLLFEQVFELNAINPEIQIVPDPEAMLAAMQEKEKSVGFLPGAWVDENKVQRYPLPEQKQATLSLPVLAVTSDSPSPEIAWLLGCLQSGAGSKVLSQIYPSALP
jgi:hypothetical protein